VTIYRAYVFNIALLAARLAGITGRRDAFGGRDAPNWSGWRGLLCRVSLCAA
jgi:hypothetical protein